jgi:hypothetical protein
MNLANAMDHTRVKEDPLSERRLTRVDMRTDPDVARALQREIAF